MCRSCFSAPVDAIAEATNYCFLIVQRHLTPIFSFYSRRQHKEERHEEDEEVGRVSNDKIKAYGIHSNDKSPPNLICTSPSHAKLTAEMKRHGTTGMECEGQEEKKW